MPDALARHELADPNGDDHAMRSVAGGLGALLNPATQLGGGTPGENFSNGIHQVVRSHDGMQATDADPTQTRLGQTDAGLATAVGVGGLATALFDDTQSTGERALGVTRGALKTTSGVATTVGNETGSALASTIATGATGPLMAIDALGAVHKAGKAAEKGDHLGVLDNTATAVDRGARSAQAISALLAPTSGFAASAASAVPFIEAGVNLAQAPIRAKEAVDQGRKAHKLGKLKSCHEENLQNKAAALPNLTQDRLDAVGRGYRGQQSFEASPAHAAMIEAGRLENARKSALATRRPPPRSRPRRPRARCSTAPARGSPPRTWASPSPSASD